MNDAASEKTADPVAEDWECAIKDVRDIPIRFLKLDDLEIKQAIREKKKQADGQAFTKKLKGKELDAFIAEEMGKFKIPGLEFYFETGVSVR